MKKYFFLFLILSLVISNYSLVIAEGETYEELMDSSKFYQEKQDFQTALQWAQKALPKAKEEFGELDTNYLTTLDAVIYNMWGNWDSICYYSNIRLNICRELFKDDNPILAENIKDMAFYYYFLDNYSQSEILYKEAVEMYKRLFKKSGSEGIGNSLVHTIKGLTDFYINIGNYKQSEPLIKESLELCRTLNSTTLLWSLQDLAKINTKKGDFKIAEQLYNEAINEAINLKRTMMEKGETEYPGVNKGEIANFYGIIGDYKKYELIYKEILENGIQLTIESKWDRISYYTQQLARFYEKMNDYNSAEALYKENINLIRKYNIEERYILSENIYYLALIYKKKKDYNQANLFFKECLEIQKRFFKDDTSALAIISLARIYLDMSDLQHADSLYNEALYKFRPEKSYVDSYVLLEIGNYFYQQGDIALADSLYTEAFNAMRLMNIAYNSDFFEKIKRVADFYTEIGNFQKAEPLYIEALEMRKRLSVDDNPELTNDKNNLAEFYSKKADFTKAESLFLEVLDNYKNMLNDYFPSLSEREKKMFWNTVSENFEGFNSFAVKRYVENPNILSNMYDMQLYSKALLFNATSKVKKRILNSNDSVLIDKYKEWSDKKEFLVKLYSMQQDSLKKKGFNVDSIEALANELEKKLSLKSEQFAQSYEKKKVNWKSVQTLLKPDEAAVEVVRFRYRDGKRFTDTVYYAFLIVNEQTEEHPEIVLLENGSQLENEFYNDYREKIKTRDDDKNSFSRYWGKLYEKLKDYKKLYFSTDGIYNKLNPATLQMPDGKYLLDIQDIQQVNSTKDIILGYYQNKQESNIYNSAVLIGNPNFSMEEEKVKELSQRIRGDAEEEKVYEPLAATRGIELTKLPGTEKEINDINNLLKSRKWDVKTYLGDMALKTAVKTVSNPRVLHIATHGMFLEDVKRDGNKLFGFDEQKLVENPLLRSGLFFTGADNYLKDDYIKPTGEENGLLTAYEAMNLDLDKTELVVLSACETGLGEIKNGEGVFGLRRAFQQAGAKTVVMSLWTVNDEATQELMSNFYSNWVTGMTKRDAFSKAQQTVKDKYKDPYYWGAFVMVGE